MPTSSSTDLDPTETLELMGRLADEVHRLHQGGKVHRAIGAYSVHLDRGSGQTSLLPPVPEKRTFGDTSCLEEPCPPELRHARSVEVPSDLAAAREVLHRAGVPVSPEQIDLYQLGALFWRLLTGEGIDRYPHDGQANDRLTPDVAEIIERALGVKADDRFTSAAELAAAVAELARRRRELPCPRLGHFTLLQRIGRGGMGEVFKAFEPGLKRFVAIKVLPSELAESPSQVQRFHVEASAAARIDHPNVVPIHFIGEDHGRHFFAMQFIAGGTLADLLERRGKLAVHETLDIIEQVLEGLQAVHDQGLIHRDIKPRNILLDARTHRAMLADFGLVKSLTAPGDLTAPGVVLGTVKYLSPEQGQGQAVDHRADLYAIGIVLFRMLGGQLPFQAATTATMLYQHAFVPAPPLRDIAPDVPASLAQIVAKLLAKTPKDRYQSADELRLALRAVRKALDDPPSSHVETVAIKPSPVEEAAPVASAAPPGRSGRQWLRSLAIFAAVLVVVGAGWGWREFHRAKTLKRGNPIAANPVLAKVEPAPLVPAVPPDRRAAEWLLGLEGRGEITFEKQRRELTAPSDLPDEPFRVVMINLFANPNVADADLASLPRLDDLRELLLGRTTIGDAAVTALPELPELRSLHLGMTGVSDESLKVLSRFPRLATLNLDETAVTDAGLRTFSSLPQLEQLSLAKTQVGDGGMRFLQGNIALKLLGLGRSRITDAGLEFVGKLSGLTHLQLVGTSISDVGLRALHGLTRLEQIDLRNTSVTDAGVAAFKASVPACQVVR